MGLQLQAKIHLNCSRENFSYVFFMYLQAFNFVRLEKFSSLSWVLGTFTIVIKIFIDSNETNSIKILSLKLCIENRVKSTKSFTLNLFTLSFNLMIVAVFKLTSILSGCGSFCCCGIWTVCGTHGVICGDTVADPDDGSGPKIVVGTNCPGANVYEV